MHIHKIVYIKTFKIAPTCFHPKIISKELYCSSVKSHFFKNTHRLIPYINLVLRQHVVLCKWYAAKPVSSCLPHDTQSGAPLAAYHLHDTTCSHNTKLI